MTHITFYSDGSHVHQRGRSGETVHFQDCEESRKLRRLLGDDWNSAFGDTSRMWDANERIFDRFDRQMRNLDRQMKAIDEAFDPRGAQQPRDREHRLRIRFSLTPAQPQSSQPAREKEIRVHVGRSNVEKNPSLCDSALSVGAITVIALGVGYLGYQNAGPISDFMRSVPDTLKNAGEAAWKSMQNGWTQATCRFTYTGCP